MYPLRCCLFQKTMSLSINGVQVEYRESDHFLNATQLCQAGGKRFSNWYQCVTTKRLIEELREKLGVEVVDVKKGNSSLYSQGSWIHPDLVVPLAQWISPSFVIRVSEWINEWRAHSETNERRFDEALRDIRPCPRTLREKEIQLRLAVETGGQTEVETPAGYIDLLTEDKVIEIKEIGQWKAAIGQILAYGMFFPEKEKWIYLFGEEMDAGLHEVITRLCREVGVRLEIL